MSEPLGDLTEDEPLGEWAEDEQPAALAPSVDPRLRKFVDALADAGGAVRVAQAKADAYEDDEKKPEWQKIAATVEVESAERKRQRAAADLDEARASLADDERAEPNVAEEPPAQTYYGSADEFVREWLSHMYSRQVSGRGSGRVWRADWWRVPEAISRIDALWRSWEHLRLDPATGMSVWWRDHADHHMAVLMDPEGPFRGSDAEVRVGTPLACEVPPAGLFPDERKAAPGQPAQR